MKLALCNEVIAQDRGLRRDFAAQAALAASLGYQGLEVAPFTLDEAPHLLPPSRLAEYRRMAEDVGMRISGLHWLLVKPDGLSLTAPDPVTRGKTRDVMLRLVDMCAALGGDVLVHGSPAQRRLPEHGVEAARDHAQEIFAAVAEQARQAGVIYCLEPLAAPLANYINTLEEAGRIVAAIGNPALRSMIDCLAARQMEMLPLPDLIDCHLPSGLIAHIQVNDSNKRGPGQGDDDFAPLIAALKRHGYTGWIAVEPFEYIPDGLGCAARSIGYLHGLMEATA
ncbi:sugar phosphate isomerase/epimerase family protein [Ferrovibrio sp.]|uniref:sugar phosphate isomerase/epimerase family protein n=1 Tax=Ferrovibrio sp. TaxID=1917215 RepID=UPI0035B2EC31